MLHNRQFDLLFRLRFTL